MKSLRLVCRYLNDVSVKYILDTVYVDLLEESFEQLLTVSAHPVFQHTVRTLVYVPISFDSFDSLKMYKLCSKDDLATSPALRQVLGLTATHGSKSKVTEKEWRAGYKENNAQVEAQERLIQGSCSCLDTTMKKAFTGFTRLKAVVIDRVDEGERWFSRPMQRVMKRILREPGLYTDQSDSHPMAILKASVDTKTQLKSLNLGSTTPSFRQEVKLSSDFFSPVLDGLTSLQLEINFPKSPMPIEPWAQAAAAFLELFQNVEDLSLEARGFRTVPLDVLVTNLPWPNLRSIVICRGGIHENNLIRFVGSHQSKLHRLEFSEVHFRSGSHSSAVDRMGTSYPHVAFIAGKPPMSWTD